MFTEYLSSVKLCCSSLPKCEETVRVFPDLYSRAQLKLGVGDLTWGHEIECRKCEHFDNSKRSLHLKQLNLFRNQTFTELKVFLTLLACSISCPAALALNTWHTHVALCISTWHAINSVRNSWPQNGDPKIINCTYTVCPDLSLL